MARFSSILVTLCVAMTAYAAPMNHAISSPSTNTSIVTATATATSSSIASPTATISDVPPPSSTANSTDAALCNVSRGVFIADLIDFAQIVQLIEASANANANTDQTTLSTIQDAKQGVQDAASAAFVVLAAAILGQEPPANALNDTATGLVDAGNALVELAQDDANGVDKNAIAVAGLKLIDLGNVASAIETSC